jgi:hypothetical protein
MTEKTQPKFTPAEDALVISMKACKSSYARISTALKCQLGSNRTPKSVQHRWLAYLRYGKPKDKTQRRREWTTRDDRFIKRQRANKVSYEHIAAQLGRTLHETKQRAQQIAHAEHMRKMREAERQPPKPKREICRNRNDYSPELEALRRENARRTEAARARLKTNWTPGEAIF